MPKQQTVTVTWYTLAEKAPEENSHIYFRDGFDSHIMDGYFYNGSIDSHWPVYMRPDIEWCYAHELEMKDGARTEKCPYCEALDKHDEGADIADEDKGWTDRFHIRKDTDGLYRIACYADESSPINFCPMCRRDLRKAAR